MCIRDRVKLTDKLIDMRMEVGLELCQPVLKIAFDPAHVRIAAAVGKCVFHDLRIEIILRHELLEALIQDVYKRQAIPRC